MTSIEERILNVFAKTFPQMSEMDKEKLLAFGEGMAIKAEQQAAEMWKYSTERLLGREQ